MARGHREQKRPPRLHDGFDEEAGYATTIVYSSDSSDLSDSDHSDHSGPPPRRWCGRRARRLCCESLRDTALVLMLAYWALDCWSRKHGLLWYDRNLVFRARGF